MDLIDFAEKQGEAQVLFSLSTLEFNRQRCHALLVLLLGGAGGALVLAAGVSTRPWVGMVACSAALWWFGIAAYLSVHGLRTSPIRSWALKGDVVMRKAQEWQVYSQQVQAEGGAPVDAFVKLREQHLQVMAYAAAEYITASTQSAIALDRAYLLAALTPLPMGGAALLAYRFLG